MTDEKTATETTTDEGAAPLSEEASAPDKTAATDLDAALEEFKTQPAGSSTDQKPVDDTKARLERVEQELVAERERKDMGSLVKNIRGDFATDEIDDEQVEVWARYQATKNPDLEKAWANRHTEPKKFEHVVKALAKVFAEKHKGYRRTDANATETREVVSDAVRGKSGKAPDAKQPNLGRMTDAEVKDHAEKNFGYTPNF